MPVFLSPLNSTLFPFSCLGRRVPPFCFTNNLPWCRFGCLGIQWKSAFARPDRPVGRAHFSRRFVPGGVSSPRRFLGGSLRKRWNARRLKGGSVAVFSATDPFFYSSPISSSAFLAAICSASFLLRPSPVANTLELSSNSIWKRLSWSGPESPARR